MGIHYKPFDRFLTKEEMEKLPTKRLLAYKKKKLSHPFNDSRNRTFIGWFSQEELDDDKKRYEEAYNNIREVLSKREHIE